MAPASTTLESVLNVEIFLQQVLNGLTLGGIYSLVALGLTLVNQMVDAFMRPEMVMHVMQARKLHFEQGAVSPNGQESSRSSSQAPAPVENPSKIEWNFERASVDKLIAYGREPGVGANEPQPGFVFERSGFADWKLTEIRLVLE